MINVSESTMRILETERNAIRARHAAAEAFASLAAGMGGNLAAGQKVRLMLLDMGTDQALTDHAYDLYLDALCIRLYNVARRNGYAAPYVGEYQDAADEHVLHYSR